jgi:hypothetical protein
MGDPAGKSERATTARTIEHATYADLEAVPAPFRAELAALWSDVEE